MNPISLQEIAGGALQENSQKAIEEVIKNMQDPNTPWKNKREIVIKLKFTQNEDRDDSRCEITVDKKLAPVKPLETKFAIAKDLSTGEVFAEEYGRQVKGQMSISDVEHERLVDTDTGEIIGTVNDGKVIDLRSAKQA